MKSFTGLRRGGRETRSLKVTAAMNYGQAVGYSTAANGDTELAVVGAGRNYVGHLAQDVTADGVTTAYHFPGLSEGMFNIPAKVNDLVDVEDWESFEAEGPLLTLTGTGGFDAAATGAMLALHTDGKWRVAQAADTATARLVKKGLTVWDSALANNVRVEIEALRGIEVV